MICLLLYPGRLPLQLVLGFMLMIGSIPGQSEGLMCKACANTADTACKETVSKDCSVVGADAVCMKAVTDDKVSQDCMTKEFATCLRTSLGYECFFIPTDDKISLKAFIPHLLNCSPKVPDPGLRRRQAEAEGRQASDKPPMVMEMTTIATTTDTGKLGYCFCETADCDSDFTNAKRIQVEPGPYGSDQGEAPAPAPGVKPAGSPAKPATDESSSAHQLDQVNSPILAIILMLTLPLYYGYIQGPM